MSDNLPSVPKEKECGIINLDSSSGPGSHWVAYFKKGDKMEYFDSFGNLKPPSALRKYFKGKIFYNRMQYQNFNTTNCGRLCLEFLLNKTYEF